MADFPDNELRKRLEASGIPRDRHTAAALRELVLKQMGSDGLADANPDEVARTVLYLIERGHLKAN